MPTDYNNVCVDHVTIHHSLHTVHSQYYKAPTIDYNADSNGMRNPVVLHDTGQRAIINITA